VSRRRLRLPAAGTRAATFSLFLLGSPTSFAAAQSEPTSSAQQSEEEEASRFWSKEDGNFDVSGFLDEKYGFLPIVLPITEPAVGYGAAAGLAFISSPLGGAAAGFGRPNVTLVGGMATENGSWGVLAADIRYWMDDRLQTIVGVVDASINLEFHGIGAGGLLESHPLDYTLEPVGGVIQSKYRLADTSRFWAGLNYAYAGTSVNFDAPPGTTGLPDFDRRSDVSGFTPSLTYDSRDNIFTPEDGSYAELGCGIFSQYLGGDDDFERLRLLAMHFMPLADSLYLGVRGDAAATFGDAPFYLRPYVSLRGVPIMRYQGEEIAQLEAELRWQFYERWSVLGFAGGGVAWNDSGALDAVQKVVSGGAGFRYEVARKYGIHAGLDVAVSRDTTAVYVQVGGAWTRP
jgi:surface antigen Omp85-like protein